MIFLGDREYFLQELRTFRDLMGKQSFWKDLEKVRLAMTALIYTYVHTKDLTETDTDFMLATTMEYDKRLILVLSM